MDTIEALHVLLLRQLKRANLSIDDIESSAQKKQWYDFISRVSRTYYDYDQEHYLLERSMDISSRELMELNNKLESAEQIAHLGYWSYDQNNDSLNWSKEIFYLTGFDPSFGTPKLNDVVKQIPKDYREKLNIVMEEAFSKGKGFCIELPYKNKQSGLYNWHYAIGHLEKEVNKLISENPVYYLKGVVMDITERKQREKEAEQTHRQLLEVSRRAGMSDVATSILHNIGNVLNSAMVSSDFLNENTMNHFLKKLFKLNVLLKEHIHDMNDYLTRDEKGKLIPKYLIELIDILDKEYQSNQAELQNLTSNLIHIKDIVNMQRNISGVSGVSEEIFLPEMIDNALQLALGSKSINYITIKKQLDNTPIISVDKSKLLQILINLIGNAKDAVDNNPIKTAKEISIVVKNKRNKLEVLVIDNGIGILPDNIDRIFSLGFTTKEDGHGYGLHSSALLAQEIGGSLKASSDGPGKGAIFTLILPKLSEQKLRGI